MFVVLQRTGVSESSQQGSGSRALSQDESAPRGRPTSNVPSYISLSRTETEVVVTLCVYGESRQPEAGFIAIKPISGGNKDVETLGSILSKWTELSRAQGGPGQEGSRTKSQVRLHSVPNNLITLSLSAESMRASNSAVLITIDPILSHKRDNTSPLEAVQQNSFYETFLQRCDSMFKIPGRVPKGALAAPASVKMAISLTKAELASNKEAYDHLKKRLIELFSKYGLTFDWIETPTAEELRDRHPVQVEMFNPYGLKFISSYTYLPGLVSSRNSFSDLGMARTLVAKSICLPIEPISVQHLSHPDAIIQTAAKKLAEMFIVAAGPFLIPAPQFLASIVRSETSIGYMIAQDQGESLALYLKECIREDPEIMKELRGLD